MNQVKELVVSAIENGTVIDHIPAGKVFDVIKILKLDESDHQLFFGTNLDSKKYEHKDIIKVCDKYFESAEINKIALVAPTATLIVIKDFQVVEKVAVSIPDTIVGIVKCANPKCITNHQKATTRFSVINKDEDLKLVCHYCEKITKKELIEFV